MHTIKLFIKLFLITAAVVIATLLGSTSVQAAGCISGGGLTCPVGTVGPITLGGSCYTCTNTGWQLTGGSCSPIPPGVCTTSSGGGGGGGGGSRPANTAGESIVNPVVAVSGTPTEAASKLINASISFLLIIAIIAALFFLIWGGVQYTTSGGDKAATQAARDKIVAALIGLALTFGAYLIAIIAGNFLGFDIGNLVIPSP